MAPVSDCFSQCVLASYPFYGTAIDTTGNNFDGLTLGPTSSTDCSGKADSSYLFDGIDDYIQLNSDNAIITTSEFSIHVKAKINGPGGGADGSLPLFSQRDDVTTSGQSIINLFAENASGNIQFNVRGSTSSNGDKLFYPTPTDNDWHCYTGTLGSDDTLRLYLDGIEVAKMESTQTGDFFTSIDHVEIGRHSYSNVLGNGLFNGSIDDVVIYNCAINPGTICCDSNVSSSITNDCLESLTMPYVFTPNQDGINELFLPSSVLSNCILTEVSIYNRWGQLVHKGSNNAWDGRTSAGEMVPEGTYFYVIVVNGTYYKGSLTLLR